MKKWSRKKKLLLCCVLLLISLFFIASITNRPSPTLEIAIARAEKQMLIGPSEIIDILDFTYSNWDHLVLGKTEHGYITYEYQDGLGWDNGYLRYYEKTPVATIFTTDYPYEQGYGEPWLPIIVFPQNRTVYDARMRLTIEGTESSASFDLRSYREPENCFMFRIPTDAELNSACYWLLQQAISCSWQEYVVAGTVEIQIDFYDHSGNLVDTYLKTVTK